MSDTKVCTACGKTNDSTASVCAFCDTPFMAIVLSQTTSHVPPPPSSKQFTPERVIQLTGLYADLLVFQIASYEQPLLVKVSGATVVIGRYSPGEKPPTVDLTPFNGSLMGVSRKHAMIIKDDEGYKVKDLASTNGTWLNEAKLNPQELHRLNSGDILRLGQVNTNVYFRLAPSRNSSEVTLTLQNEIQVSKSLELTTVTLESVLIPYLKALEGFQKTCDEIMNQPVSEMLVTNVLKDPEKAQIIVKVSGLFQAFRLLRINVQRWRETHIETITKLNQEATPAKFPDWSILESAHSSEEGQPDLTLQKAGVELAHEIFADLAPHRTKEENEIHIPKLLPYLQCVALSPLKVIEDTN